MEEKIKRVPVFFGKILPGKTLFTPDMSDDIALLFIWYVRLRRNILKTFPDLLELISNTGSNTTRLFEETTYFCLKPAELMLQNTLTRNQA